MNVKALVAQLKAACEAYYNTGTPTMTDDEYDTLVTQLKKADPANDFFKTLGAPVSSLFKPVKHQIPMGSLDKVKDAEELKKWWDKLPVKEVVVQWKYDGASISLEYKDSKLVRAVSRGDGITGEDVTENIRRSKYIPEELTQPFNGFIRGECILFKDDFTKFFPGGSNPRNVGNGAMRSKDGAGCEHLRVLAYDVEGTDSETEIGKLRFLKNNGFEVHLMQKLTTVDNVIKAHEEMAKVREKLAFEVDGIVIKCNDVDCTAAMGVSDGRPKAQRAFKFEALGAETVVTDIEWTVGHTGAVIPTFKVETRNIGGVNVSSVLMNNVGYCEAMDVAVGDHVLVVRAGDVIPHINGVIDRLQRIYTCPKCGKKGTADQLRVH